ncbi:MAG: radical SAM protein [Candidatus Omnitrophota bacterium]
MKVLLIRSRPTRVENTRLPKSLANEIGYVMPLGLASIAAYLREKGIPVSIIDAEVEELSLEQIRKSIIKLNPDIVGITSMTPTVHDDVAVARVAKSLGIKVVMGGPQINAMPKEMMQIFPIDFGILGEGEYPTFKLVEALDKNLSLDTVPGIIYKDENEKIIMKPPYIHQNLDELPVPARDLLPYERYFSIISKGRLATVCPGRGCPFTCGFCFKQPSDREIRYRNPKLIVDEIEELINKNGINEINFVSDTFTVNKDFIISLSQELIDRRVEVSWLAPTRADCVTPELLKLMKRAGCRSLRFGVESGSARILKLMGKDTNKDRVVQAFKWAREAKIETFAYLIIGYLHETEGTIKETLEFVKKLKADLLMYNIATPLPTTRLFEQAVEAGVIEPDYWKKFLLNEKHRRVSYLFKDTEKWIIKAYRQFFFSPRFICKKIFEIRPNNIRNYFKALRGILRLNRDEYYTENPR